jgi:hypothetical protein
MSGVLFAKKQIRESLADDVQRSSGRTRASIA